MNEIIKTKSIGKNFAKTNGIMLEQTATTALAFFPQIHPGGVRGDLVRFKKDKNDNWERIPEENFRQLQLYEGVHIELGTQQLQKLIEEIEKRKMIANQGVSNGRNEYIVANKENALLINDQNKKNILEKILTQGYSKDFWDLVGTSNPELADKLSAGHLQCQRRKIVEDLKNRLKGKFYETKGNDSWQHWIYDHNWLFGANYQKPIEKQRINISGSMPDYLFPTLDGFVDILEIKLPSFEVIEEDKSHNSSWVWSKESNQAIGQVVNYLCEIERLRLEIERQIFRQYSKGVSMLKPRAFILIGQSDDWCRDKSEGLRKLNYSLHGIEVLTYSDIVKRGESFIEFSTNKI